MKPGANQPRPLACQQILTEDASVFSVQWLVLPAAIARGITPELLLERYRQHIRRFTLALVQPRALEGRMAFCLGPSNLALLEFTGPTYFSEGEVEGVRLQICGGFLVQPAMCDRGQLELVTEKTGEGLKVTLRLSDFCPLLLGNEKPAAWRRWLYRMTQAAIHKLVTVRFLLRLYRDLAGPEACVRVVAVRVREGRRT